MVTNSAFCNKTMSMDLSACDVSDVRQFRRLLSLGGDLCVHLFRVEELLGDLDQTSVDFHRLSIRFNSSVSQLREIQNARRRIMRMYGLDV